MKLTIEKSKLDKISLAHLVDKYPHPSRYHLTDPAGAEPHRLYAYISSIHSYLYIADIGTRTGNSALAFSFGMSTRVDSYDIDQGYIDAASFALEKPNLRFFCKDILTSKEILEYGLISLDVDPHDGRQERKCFDYLLAEDWKGWVLLDDIGPMWPAMHEWWNSIQLPKWDLTAYGHASGTGLVDFGTGLEVELL